MLGACSRALTDAQREGETAPPKPGESRESFTEEVVFNQPRRLHMGQASRGNGRRLAGVEDAVWGSNEVREASGAGPWCPWVPG